MRPLVRCLAFLAATFCALAFAPLRLAATDPFFFIQLSDPQMGMFTDNADFAQDAANFEFAIATVNRLHPTFVVITGDLVNKGGHPAQIAEYRRIVARIDPAIPVYSLPGNHDVENMPTPATLEAYTKIFGPDHYTFRHQDLVGIVLDSTVIHTPQHVTAQLLEQDRWLRAELARAKAEGAKHIVVFQHHPWFIKSADEPDGYFNIPLARRSTHLALFHEFGVHYLFCGHYHRHAEAHDGDLVNITAGAVGKPLGGAKSGLLIAIVRDDRIDHRFYEFGELPTRVDLSAPATHQKPTAAGAK